MQCKKCVHIYVNAKMIPVETIPGIGMGDKEEQWRG
jgi:rubredoxin